MTRKYGPKQQAVRHWFVISVLILIVCGVVYRLMQLMWLDRDFLLNQGDARALRVVNIPAYRGMITDRNGEPLAVSTPVESVWVNPQKFNRQDPRIPRLASLLGYSEKQIRQIIEAHVNREFLYLKRAISPAIVEQIAQLKIDGVSFQREFHRFYPEGESSAHLLGFTNIDDQGQEGLELGYNQWLRGVPGKKRVVKDRYGRNVEDLGVLQEAKPGRDLVLSVDKRLQFLAYSELKQAIERCNAQSGSVVVLDIKTGEILAMTNFPSYNPNNRPNIHDGRYRNRALTDIFEPGSTIKAFSVANALQSGKFSVDTSVDTRPGFMLVDGNKVQDHRNYGVLDIAGILQHSSNVGVTKLTLSLPAENLWTLLHNVGFGEKSATYFPGESAGTLPNHPKWRDFVLATLSFGYGMSANTLQLAQAYAVFGAQGIRRPVSMIRVDEPRSGDRVLDETVAKNMLLLLEKVTEYGGTATAAHIDGYRVSGKTGTVRVLGGKGYEKDRHNGIFVGIAPASAPRLVAAVVINDIQSTQYYGGLAAAPVFSKVMESALRFLNVPPDAPHQENVVEETKILEKPSISHQDQNRNLDEEEVA